MYMHFPFYYKDICGKHGAKLVEPHSREMYDKIDSLAPKSGRK